MQINRQQVKRVFAEYTSAYDCADEKVRLKINHTYRVADLCERIARSLGMDEGDADLAWLLGMLHDVGRFEQLRQYKTFIDAESVDHAALGVDILYGALKGDATQSTGSAADEGAAADTVLESDGGIRAYVAEDTEDALIETAIRWHNAYRIPEQLSARTETFCHILRDADKIDILKVNVEVPLEEIYNTTTEILRSAEVTEAVMESFYEHHATLRDIKKTQVDHVVGHCSLVFELVFAESLRIVREQGYLAQLLAFESTNARTMEQFAALRVEMERYLEDARS